MQGPHLSLCLSPVPISKMATCYFWLQYQCCQRHPCRHRWLSDCALSDLTITWPDWCFTTKVANSFRATKMQLQSLLTVPAPGPLCRLESLFSTVGGSSLWGAIFTHSSVGHTELHWSELYERAAALCTGSSRKAASEKPLGLPAQLRVLSLSPLLGGLVPNCKPFDFSSLVFPASAFRP